MNPFTLENRSVLITGASGHLGSAMARAVAAAGADLILAGRKLSALESVRDEVESSGGRTELLRLDVEDPSSVDAAITHINARRTVLHGVVNGAARVRSGSPEAVEDAQFDAAWRQNVVSPVRLVMGLADLLGEAARITPGGASVVNVASMYGTVSPDPRIYAEGEMNPINYGAAKAGMIQMTRYLACHLAGRGIRVNALSPGAFPEPSTRADAEEFHRSLESRTPLARVGVAEEVGGPLVFLLSSAASYVTGANLPVDGGWTAW